MRFPCCKSDGKRAFCPSHFYGKGTGGDGTRKRRGASDFAGKEAVVKAFGTGFAGIDACEVEILRRESGAPYVTLYGAARKKAEEMGITD